MVVKQQQQSFEIEVNVGQRLKRACKTQFLCHLFTFATSPCLNLVGLCARSIKLENYTFPPTKGLHRIFWHFTQINMFVEKLRWKLENFSSNPLSFVFSVEPYDACHGMYKNNFAQNLMLEIIALHDWKHATITMRCSWGHVYETPWGLFWWD